MVRHCNSGMTKYLIRAATEEDFDDVCELAGFLDTVNLPNDPGAIRALLDTSEASFSGAITDPRRREYVFVLRDLEADRAIGTSMVIGQLGRRDAPYIYFDVRHEEKYSATLDRHFIHRWLSIAYSYDGPTEIGGLVMHPDYRRTPERLGMLISYVRFLFIASRRRDFRDQLLSELLPPLEPDGRSHLWEAIGSRFTGLTYRDADRLSKRNKEFIRALFPDNDICASLLSPEAQAVIGQVGEQTRGVEKLLRRIGFDYAHRVDPFDGGPHFLCATDGVLPVAQSRACAVEIADAPNSPVPCLAARNFHQRPYFVALPSAVGGTPTKRHLSPSAATALGAAEGDVAWFLPL